MTDDHTTRTDLHHASDPAGTAQVPVLRIAQHPNARLIGRRRLIADGEAVMLGRGSRELSAGALDIDLMSRKHALVERRGESITLRDLGSRNGTFVNGRRIDAHQLELHDVIGLGPVMVLFGFEPVIRPPNDSQSLVGLSAAMGGVVAQIGQVAHTDATVLIQGETGVGKELVAGELHGQSGRAGRLVAVNCASLSDPLVHSELFGHTRGAFSGAATERAGLVAAAAAGTLFLDEIGDASPALQVSLLRLLEQREYRPVGSDRLCSSDARFIGATHRPLWQAADEGRFRHDLLARLTQEEIVVPPLRERPIDVIPVARHLGEQLTGAPVSLARELALALLRHRWPHNVRELKSIIELAVRERAADQPLELSDAVRQRLHQHAVDHSDEPARAAAGPPPRPSPEQLEAGLADHGYNMQALANHLSVSRNTIYRWFEEAGLDIRALRRRKQR